MNRILLAILATCICACAPVETHVSRFHRLAPKGSGQTFSIEQPKSSQAIESSSYAARIAAGFERYGWQRASGPGADYKVTFDYAISGGRDVQGSVPIIGQTGGGTTYHSGTFNTYGASGNNSGSVSGTSYTPATFGVVGSRTINSTLYERILLVNAFDRSGASVLEARCKSTGESPDISYVMPAMIDSLFTGFPGVSGRSKVYTKSPGQ